MQWSTTQLEVQELDFANDLCLLPHQLTEMKTKEEVYRGLVCR